MWGVGPGHCSQRMLSDAGSYSAGKHRNGIRGWGIAAKLSWYHPPRPKFLLLAASWPIVVWQQAGTWASVLPTPRPPPPPPTRRLLSSSLNLQASELWGLSCCPSVHAGSLTPGTRHVMKLRLHLAHLFFWLLAVGPSFQHLNTGAKAHTLVGKGTSRLWRKDLVPCRTVTLHLPFSVPMLSRCDRCCLELWHNPSSLHLLNMLL